MNDEEPPPARRELPVVLYLVQESTVGSCDFSGRWVVIGRDETGDRTVSGVYTDPAMAMAWRDQLVKDAREAGIDADAAS